MKKLLPLLLLAAVTALAAPLERDPKPAHLHILHVISPALDQHNAPRFPD